jgi:hypothetical protein
LWPFFICFFWSARFDYLTIITLRQVIVAEVST